MEKRFTIALILSLLVIFIWQQTLPKPKPGPKEEQGKTAESGKTGEREQPAAREKTPDRPRPEPRPAEIFEERTFVIENDFLRLRFTNRGGALDSVVLLDQFPTAAHRKEGKVHLELLSDYGARIGEAPVRAFGLQHLSWEGAGLLDGEWQARSEPEARRIVFTRRVKRGEEGAFTLEITKEFRLPSEDARFVEFQLSYRYLGAEGGAPFRDDFRFFTSGGVWQERNSEATNPGASFMHPEEEGAEDGLMVTWKSLQDKPEGMRRAFSGSLRYLADLSSYFGAFLLFEEGLPKDARADFHALLKTPELINTALRTGGSPGERTFSATEYTLTVPVAGEPVVQKGILYLGSLEVMRNAPVLAETRPEVTHAFEKVVENKLTLKPVAKAIIFMLRWFHDLCGNWGWAIVLLTLTVRIVLFPINRRSQGAMLQHTEAMARIKPKIEALKKKYEKDPRKFAQEQMALMKREGVSVMPLGGCLPLLLQMPIFFGLFSALRSSVDLRQASWLWVADLSQPDNLIPFSEPITNPLNWCCCPMPQPPITGLNLLPILMTIAWFLNSYLMPRPTTSDPQVEQQRKMMMFMPILFGFMMYSYASGLSLYWLTSSALGIFEMKVIKKYFPVKPPKKKRQAPARG